MLAAPVLLPIAAAGAQTTIDFAVLPVPPVGSTAVPAPYSQDGYRIGCVSANAVNPCPSFSLAGPAAAFYTGGPALSLNNAAGIVTLNRENGGLFDLLSIRLAPITVGSGQPVNMVFEGTLGSGGTVNQTFSVAPTPTVLGTFSFANTFRDLVSVRFRVNNFEPALVSNGPTFDDIVVRDAATTVPEPGTWALLGTGLLAVAGVAAGRKRGAG